MCYSVVAVYFGEMISPLMRAWGRRERQSFGKVR